jgi:hypothetical protein
MNQMPAYDNFYLNWDTYYNNEPFYGTFRKQDYRELLTDAGFADDQFIEATMPRYTFVGEDTYKEAIEGDNTFDSKTGRMDPNGTRWYGFGAWKSKRGVQMRRIPRKRRGERNRFFSGRGRR